MIEKIKEYFVKRKQAKVEKKKNQQMQKYYKLLRTGAMFLEYINKDIEKQKEHKMNRKQRRRFTDSLVRKGTFSKEMVEYYAKQVDDVLKIIDSRLNSKKLINNKIKAIK